ncbi:uncharacterized protein EV154DRAFT_579710 [Mucor mucedo]|uniref:uncharacterized protein n=1 Tax=Mucor mucedo TaxID=29922 RepID=UPI00221F9014|nr:uncharacterized protein EV154DRAFT_579710 [Mucor mucedo]KAI7872252.1 hypothetical protein EV154DRAFT_579710 [Mucor mucedo]
MPPCSKLFLKLTPLLFLFSQLAQAFCVYNKLEGERVSIKVSNLHTTAPTKRMFTKTIAQGERECCPYTNEDCVSGGQRDSPIILSVYFAFDLLEMWEVKRQYVVHCEGGAGIVLTGSDYNNIEATCFKANRNFTREKLEHWTLA